jgi:hypothetical protein
MSRCFVQEVLLKFLRIQIWINFEWEQILWQTGSVNAEKELIQFSNTYFVESYKQLVLEELQSLTYIYLVGIFLNIFQHLLTIGCSMWYIHN